VFDPIFFLPACASWAQAPAGTSGEDCIIIIIIPHSLQKSTNIKPDPTGSNGWAWVLDRFKSI
jgi:hypothetical protein